MKYGVFVDNESIVHVAPVDNDGIILPPHTVDVFYECDPVIERADHGTVFVHNTEN